MYFKLAFMILGLFASIFQSKGSFPPIVLSGIEGMTPGRGYETMSGSEKNDCVVGNLIRVPQGEGTRVIYKSVFVSSQEEKYSAVTSEATASGSVGFISGNLKLSFVRLRAVTKFESQYVVYIDVTMSEDTLHSPRLTNDMRSLICRNPLQFRARCGNYFASTMVMGGELALVIRFKSSSETEKARFELEFGAKLKGFFESNIQLSIEDKEAISKKFIDVSSYMTGLTAEDAENPSTWEQAQPLVASFATKVKLSGGVVKQVRMLHMQIVGSVPVTPGPTESVRANFESKLLLVDQVLANIAFVGRTPQQFNIGPQWERHLLEWASKLQRARLQLTTLHDQCLTEGMCELLPLDAESTLVDLLEDKLPVRFKSQCPKSITVTLDPLSVHRLPNTYGDNNNHGHEGFLRILLNAIFIVGGTSATITTFVEIKEGRPDFSTFSGTRIADLVNLEASHPGCVIAKVTPNVGALFAQTERDPGSKEISGGTGMVDKAVCVLDTQGSDHFELGCPQIFTKPITIFLQPEESFQDPNGMQRLKKVEFSNRARRQYVNETGIAFATQPRLRDKRQLYSCPTTTTTPPPTPTPTLPPTPTPTLPPTPTPTPPPTPTPTPPPTPTPIPTPTSPGPVSNVTDPENSKSNPEAWKIFIYVLVTILIVVGLVLIVRRWRRDSKTLNAGDRQYSNPMYAVVV